jgi:hypothetical protein
MTICVQREVKRSGVFAARFPVRTAFGPRPSLGLPQALLLLLSRP